MRFDQRRLQILAVCVGIPVIFLLMPPTQPVMFATLGIFSHAVLWVFDCAFGAVAFGIPPVVMWAVVGAVVGACLGFWSIAPAVGKRRMRRVAGAIPLTLLGCLLVGDALFSIATSPRPPTLRPTRGRGANQAQTTGAVPTDPNSEKAPSVYTPPSEELLSNAPEGGGGPAEDKTVPLPPDSPRGAAGTGGATAGTTGAPPPTSTNPLDRLRGH